MFTFVTKYTTLTNHTFARMAPKAVLITGCSAGGFGDALAQEFHAKGLLVFATARSLSKMSHLATMGMKTLALDVNDPASISAAVESVRVSTGGTLDILVNNSAIGMQNPLFQSALLTLTRWFHAPS